MDCRIWRSFLQSWNGKSFFLSKEVWCDEAQFSTDASGDLGHGGYFKGAWFSEPWPKEYLRWSIAAKELYPIVLAAQLWGERWKGLRVLVNCDNEPTVAAINKGYSKKVVMGNLLRVLIYLSMLYNFYLRARHIPGKLNRRSDLLSRLQVRKFLDENPEANPIGEQVQAHPLGLYSTLSGT
jgi:hypothetical protein